MYLIGYYNPYHSYPSRVVPIISKESKIFAIYRDNNILEYREIPEFLNYNRLSEEQILEFDHIDVSENSLFALNPNDIVFYSTEKELLNIIVESKVYIKYNSYLLFNLAISTGDDFLCQFAFRKCITQLIGIDKSFANDWYNKSYKIAKKKMNLPNNIEEYLKDFNIIKIGCSIDKIGLITELNNLINSDNAFFKEFNAQLVIYEYKNSDLEQAFLNKELDIIIPESNDFFEQCKYEKFDKGKYYRLCSSRITLILNSKKINLEKGSGEVLQLFFENLLGNQDFSFIRPRSSTQYGKLIDIFILKNIFQLLGYNDLGFAESIIKKVENKVKRYINSDQELLDCFKSESIPDIDSFFIKKSSVREFKDVIPDDFVSIEIDLDDRFNHESGMYVVNSNINFLNIPNRFEQLLFENEYLRKSHNIECPLTEVSEKMQNELLSEYKDFAYYTLQRPLSINLVVDTSGSMHGEKMDSVQDAIRIFIALLNSERGDKLGIVEFNNSANIISPIDFIANNEDRLFKILRELNSHGRTALLDAINLAIDSLKSLKDDAIKIIIVLTDGHENCSRTTTDDVFMKIKNINNDIYMFGFAFGRDADLNLLNELSMLTGGYTHEGTISNIKRLFSYIARQF